MANYTALDSTGRIQDIVCKSDKDAIEIVKAWHYKCLIKVRSFTNSSPIATILPYKAEGY